MDWACNSVESSTCGTALGLGAEELSIRTLCLCNSITAHCVRACGYHATHTIYRVHDDNNDDGNGNDDAKVQRNQLAHGTDQGHNSCVCGVK